MGPNHHEKRGIRARSSKQASQPAPTLIHMLCIYRGVLALIIINKAGGLIYNRNFGDGLNKLDTNDYLVLAGTFHG